MDVCEPHVRRRGFFLHTETGEVETAEHENPEGFVVRVRIAQGHSRHIGSSTRRVSRMHLVGGQSEDGAAGEHLPQIRSGSVTGSRQRSHSHR